MTRSDKLRIGGTLLCVGRYDGVASCAYSERSLCNEKVAAVVERTMTSRFYNGPCGGLFTHNVDSTHDMVSILRLRTLRTVLTALGPMIEAMYISRWHYFRRGDK